MLSIDKSEMGARPLSKKKAIYELYQQKKMGIKDICDMFKITKPTLYKAVNEISKNQ